MKKILLIFLLLASIVGYSQTALELPYGVKVVTDDAADWKRGPWADAATAVTNVPLSIRQAGLVVFLLDCNCEYIWLDGDLSDSGLVPSIGILADGSGTTANGNAIDMGGTLTGNIEFNGDFDLWFGQGTKMNSFQVFSQNDAIISSDNDAFLSADKAVSIDGDSLQININGNGGSTGEALMSDGVGGVKWDTPSGGGGGSGTVSSGTTNQLAKYPSNGTTVQGTDVKTVAGQSIIGSGNIALQGQTIGNIYSEDFAAGGTLGTYTNVGSGTATASGTDLDISGGTAGVTTNVLRRDLTSSITNNYRHVIFSPTANTSGEAIGIGYVSRSSVTPMTMYVTFCPAATTNRGQIKIHAIDAVGTNNTVATSSTNLSYTNGDLLDIVINYGGTGNVEVTIKNLSASVSPIHVEFISPNIYLSTNSYIATYSPALYPMGATWSVYLDEYGTNDSYGPILVRAGDSITAGGFSGGPNQSEPGYTSTQLMDGKVITFACGGNTAENLYNSFSQILNYAPKYVAIMAGANDIGQSVSLGTITTPGTYLYFIEQMVQQSFANDIIPIICYITPVSAGLGSTQSTVNTWNAALLSNFSGRCIVLDWATPLMSGGNLASYYDAGDGLHISYAGHIKMSEYFIANTPLHWYAKPAYGVFPTGVTIGKNNTVTTLVDDFPGVGSVPANSSGIIGAPIGGLGLFSSANGSAGISIKANYWDGSSYKSGWEFANVSSGFTSLKLIPAGGKVGIINSSPSEALDVVGNVKFSGALMPNNTAGTSGDVLTSQGAGAAPIWSPAGGGGITNGAANNELMKSNGTNAVASGLFSTTSGGLSFIGTDNQMAYSPLTNFLSTTKLTTSGSSAFGIISGAGISGAIDGQDLLLAGANAFGTGNGNGGDAVLQVGLPNGSGTIGRAYVNYSASGSFKIDGLVDNVSLAGTTLTLTDDLHRGKVIYCTSGSATTITVPSGLPLGFTCTIIQDGGGTVSLSASGTTLHGKVATTAQYDAITIDYYKSSETYIGF